jgi:hypothetical protein
MFRNRFFPALMLLSVSLLGNSPSAGNEIFVGSTKIKPDARLTEWQKLPLRFYQDEQLSVGILYDGEYLSLLLKGDWEKHRRQLLFGGLTIDIKSGKKRYAIQYRPNRSAVRSLAGQFGNAAQRPSGPRLSPFDFFSMCEIIFIEDDEQLILPLHNEYAAFGAETYSYWLELSLPMELAEKRGFFKNRPPKVELSVSLGGIKAQQGDEAFTQSGRPGGGRGGQMGSGRPDDMMSGGGGRGKAGREGANTITINETFTIKNH